ncbi:MAG: hypothetical protein HC883_01460 [Bdellovibrionaceae bacterium]|nr:hypothetical protein [Pseudobdellovibrionaceae bacterium]
MAFAFLDNLGEIGWVPDLPPGDLPLNAWTETKNVKFTGTHMENVSGSSTFNDLSAKFDSVLGLGSTKQAGDQRWYAVGLVGTTAKVERFTSDPGSATVTPSSPLLIVAKGKQITGGTLDETYILNTGNLGPTYAFPASGSAVELQYSSGVSLASKLKFSCVRPWRQHLWGLGVTVTGTVDSVPAGTYPRLLWASDAADPGFIPGNWQASNPASLSRNYVSPFINYSGDLVDLVPLDTNAILYQENACHLMRYTGEFPALVSIGTLFTEFGLLAPNCAVQFRGQHIAFGFSDVILHNGQSAESLLRSRVRRWLFRNISDVFYKNSFIVPNYQEKEIYICFPLLGQEYPTQALVWNYEYNTFSVREFPSAISCGAIGFQKSAGASVLYEPAVPSLVLAGFDGQMMRVGTGPGAFNAQAQAQTQSLLAVNVSDDNLLVNAVDLLGVGEGYLQDLVPFQCVAERQGFAFSAEDVAPHTRTLIREVWPELDGEFFLETEESADLALNIAGDFLAVDNDDILSAASAATIQKKGTVDIYIGGTELLASEMRWQGPFEFTIGEDDFIPVLVEGRRHGIRIEWNNGANVRVKRIGFDFEFIGRF